MLRLALYSERAGQCVLFILFVLDNELFCLKDAVLLRRPRIFSSLFMITVVLDVFSSELVLVAGLMDQFVTELRNGVMEALLIFSVEI